MLAHDDSETAKSSSRRTHFNQRISKAFPSRFVHTGFSRSAGRQGFGNLMPLNHIEKKNLQFKSHGFLTADIKAKICREKESGNSSLSR